MKRYEEAFPHWKRALEMNPDCLAPAYSMASCYEERRDWANAYAVYTHIADNLEHRGFEAEVNYPRALAEKCKEKIAT